ncbi:MAG: alkaline phosphatase family protein [Actinomycetota bacterium]
MPLLRLAVVLLAAGVLSLSCTSEQSEPPERSAPPASEEGRDAQRAGEGWRAAACALPTRYVRLIDRGNHPTRSPDLIVVPRAPNFFGTFRVTTHSGPWRYLQEVPLVLYGPGFVRAQGALDLDREVTVADVAPTLAELLEVDWAEGGGGRALHEALVPPAERPEPPRMILVIVWDGGGWNVLKQWPEAWPNLETAIDGGTSVMGADVGSSPSVTPAIHTTLGTGTWPREHGIVDLQHRKEGELTPAFRENQADDLEAPTLADIYDPTTDNRAQVGMLGAYAWHIGMIGHGAALPGGDKDIAVMGNGSAGDIYTNDAFYSLPPYLADVPGVDEDVRTTDGEDGRLDEEWFGNPVLSSPDKWVDTPVQIRYQTRQLTTLFEREAFGRDEIADLFYVNYKQLDRAGHIYNMVNEEVHSALSATDDQLGDLMEFMDERVGERRWVVAVTADHGQTPDAEGVGAWPINIDEVKEDAAEQFDMAVGDLFQAARVTGFWLDRAGLEEAGVEVDDVASWLIRYRIRDNVTPELEVPAQYEDRTDERLFEAAFPKSAMSKVMACTRND